LSEFAFVGVVGQNERVMGEKNQLYFGDNLDVLLRYLRELGIKN